MNARMVAIALYCGVSIEEHFVCCEVSSMMMLMQARQASCKVWRAEAISSGGRSSSLYGLCHQPQGSFSYFKSPPTWRRAKLMNLPRRR